MKRIVVGLLAVMCLLLLTIIVLSIELNAQRGVQFQVGWYDWLFYLVYGGWFGYVLLRIVGLFVVGLAVRRVWRRSFVVGVSLAVLAVLSLSLFAFMKSYSPAGIYGAVDQLEGNGDHYYVFGGGRVRYVDKDTDVQWGRYEKTLDGWTLTTADHVVYKLKASWFGLCLTNVAAPKSKMIWGRRIVPFLRPDWMPNWLQ